MLAAVHRTLSPQACLWHYNNAFWCLLRWASGLHLKPCVVVATNRFLLFIDKYYSTLWMNCHSLLKQLPWRTFDLLPVLNNYGWLIDRNIHMYVSECYIFIRMLSNCFCRLGTSLYSFLPVMSLLSDSSASRQWQKWATMPGLSSAFNPDTAADMCFGPRQDPFTHVLHRERLRVLNFDKDQFIFQIRLSVSCLWIFWQTSGCKDFLLFF